LSFCSLSSNEQRHYCQYVMKIELSTQRSPPAEKQGNSALETGQAQAELRPAGLEVFSAWHRVAIAGWLTLHKLRTAAHVAADFIYTITEGQGITARVPLSPPLRPDPATSAATENR
jgi:hypothetical protein